MRIDHAKLRRIVLCTGTCFAVLGVSQVAHAADTRFDAFMGRVVGNQTTVGFGTGGTPLATSSAGLGTPSTVGNMGLSQAGTGVSVDGKVKVPLGATGKAAEVLAKTPVSRAAMLSGVARVLSGPAAGLALAAAAPALVEWLGRGRVQINPDATDYPDKPFVRENRTANCGYVWQPPPMEGYVSMGASAVWTSRPTTAGMCQWGYEYWYPPLGWAPLWYPIGTVPVTDDIVELLPASLADISPYMDPPSEAGPPLTPQVVKQAIEHGVDPFGAASPTVDVSGPASVPGAKRTISEQVKLQPGTTTEAAPSTGTQSQPGTKTTTTTETHKLTYQGDKVSYTTINNTTTNITNNVTGDTTNIAGPTTETENDAPDPDERSECEKNPDSLSCADLDEPDGEIPKSTASVAYQDENPFGGGACPASKYTNVGGQSVKVWDWEQTCGYITGPVYWITVTLGAFAATMIVAGGTGARL